MSEKTKRALKTLQAALLLGILGDGLLRATPWGLNILLWTGALLSAVMILLEPRRRKSLLAGEGQWLLVTASLFAAAFAWRDSVALNCLAGLGLIITLALVVLRARKGRIWLAGISEYVMGFLIAGINTFFAGFALIFFEVRWREIPIGGRWRHLKGVLGGVAIAIPLLMLFGALLVSADASFERLVNGFFFTNHEEVFGHIFFALFLAWLAGGFLRGLLFGWEVKIEGGRATLIDPAWKAGGDKPSVEKISVETVNDKNRSTIKDCLHALQPKPISLGIVQIGVTLGLLNLLFLAFVLIQLRYFFGGALSGGMTYAEYYRRGFFELVAVAALVLPLLLGAHWLLRKENAAHERIFRLLAGTQVLLLFVIMASAVRRMLLYQSEYGLTEQRLYTTAFMGWLALVFVWFVATALRGRREQFACGALIAGLLMIMTLHVINPDAFIVRVNVAHARAGRSFDTDYAATLSADATPALLEALPALSESDRRIIATRMLNRWTQPDNSDWRNWNWSRSQSAKAVGKQASALREMISQEDGTQATERQEQGERQRR